MANSWQTVRVFISSTFRDMQAERDHLVRFVFPKLRQELLQRRIHLVDVDLRWGVTSEQDALSVCREVVDECRPRFLCMLGGRYGWAPPGKTRSITADEVHYGVLDRDLKSRGFAYFYFRDPSDTAAMVEAAPGEFSEPAGSHGAVALAELKTAITDAGLQPVIYRAQWDNQSRRLIGLKEFGDRVYADIKQSVDQQFGPATGEKPDEFTEENAAMEAFIEERVQRFVLGSRQTVWNELRQHAESTGGNGYLCLTGESGSGKSALLANFYRRLQTENREPKTENQPLVIPHFVGASPGSTDVRRTLRRLCHELVTGTGLTAEIPEDPEKLRVAFAEILQQASAQKRVVILLDAINQFDPTTQLAGWSWLPEELPATVRIILSTLAEPQKEETVGGQRSAVSAPQTVLSPQSSVVSPVLETFRHRGHPPKEIELEPLSLRSAVRIVQAFLHRYRKQMDRKQRRALLSKADAGVPLYLLVALEELRTLGTYEEITARIAQLPTDTRALFIWILKRLEDDDGFRDASSQKIGRELVSRFVSLLGASRHGLSQQELVELLSPGDPQGNVAALMQLLCPYLMQRGGLLDFYHGQFREAVGQAYLETDDKKRKAHAELAEYFHAQDYWCESVEEQHLRAKRLPPTPRPVNVRKVDELPWQTLQTAILDSKDNPHSDCWNKVLDQLINWQFLQAKVEAALVLDLVRDFSAALVAMQKVNPKYCIIEAIQGMLRLSAQVLARDSLQLAGQLIGRLGCNELNDIRSLVSKAKSWRGATWLLPLNNNLTPPNHHGVRLVFQGHREEISSLTISPDDRFVVSTSSDEPFLFWDLSSGEIVERSRTISGSVLAVTPDNCNVLTRSEANVILADIHSGQPLRRIQIKDDVQLIVADHGGHYFAYTAQNNCIHLIEIATFVEYRNFQISGDITCLAFSPDDDCLVCGCKDGLVHVWRFHLNPNSIRTVRSSELAQFPTEIRGICITPDGRRIITKYLSMYATVRVIQTDTGQVLHKIAPYHEHVAGVTSFRDNERIMVQFQDRCVMLDLDSGQLQEAVEHQKRYPKCRLTRFGRKIVIAAQNVVTVWEVAASNSQAQPNDSASIPWGRKTFITERAKRRGYTDLDLRIRAPSYVITDAETGEQLPKDMRAIFSYFMKHSTGPGIRFTPDIRRCAVVQQNQLRIRDKNADGTRSTVCSYVFDSELYDHAIISPDERTVLAFGDASNLHFLWVVDPDDPIEEA